MTTFTARFVLTFAALVCASEGMAGPLSKIVREAAEAGTRRSGKAAREGLESLAEKGAGRLGANGGALIVRASDDVAKPIIAKFGDDGARALGSLSPKGAERLAAMSDDLTAGGRGKDWMKLIAERGDEVTDWLWKRRGSVAVGTVAAVVLLQPEEFLAASERVATATISTAGEHVAGPMVKGAASAIPWVFLWLIVISAGAIWLLSKEPFAGFRRRLLMGGVNALMNRHPRGDKSVQRQTNSRDAGSER